MRGQVVAAVAVLTLSLFCGPAVVASDLKIDGVTSTEKVLGEALTITVTGAPGMSVGLLVDVSSGPTSAYGQQLPLGFSPFVLLLNIGSIPGGGTLTLPASVPDIPSLDGQHLYLLAVVFDSAYPFGLDFSNGADFTIDGAPDGGASQAAMVGQKVVLDGTDVATPNGTVKPGWSISWWLTSAPPGSMATIQDSLHPFATLIPDLPGDYHVRTTINTGSTSFMSTSTIHAWKVDTAIVTDGMSIIVPAIPVNAVLSGPAGLASLTLDGQSMAVDGQGNFGPVNISFDPGEVVDEHHIRISHSDGTVANKRLSFFFGNHLPFASASSEALSAQINESATDDIAELGEVELEGADIKGLLLSLPPELVANEERLFGFTIFSAWIDFDDLTYNSDIDLQLDPQNGSIWGKVVIKDVKAYFSVWGEILEIGYSLTGDLSSNPTNITANLVGSASNGSLSIAVQNVVVDRQNFNFNLNGFLGGVAELFIIESAVKEDVEATIASVVQSELGPAIEEILNGFVIEGNLYEALEVDINIQAPITGVAHSDHGVTIRLDSTSTVESTEPAAPPITHYRGSSAAAPVFASTTPSGQGYGAALSMSDDFINQLLASATASGLLDGDLTSLIPSEGSPVSLATDQLAILLPDCGFELWPVGTECKLTAHGTTPPTLQLTPGAPTMGTIHLANLEIEFEVDTPYGPVPLLRVSSSGYAEVDIGAGLDGTLEVSVVNTALTLGVVRTFPGANQSVIEGQISFLAAALGVALPQIIDALGSIPLPSLEAAGLGLDPTEIDFIGSAGAHVGMFGDLKLLPPP